MAELIMLTCDIGGPSATGAERIRFGVNGKQYEIDLAPELAEKLRAEYAVFTEPVRLTGTLDGVPFESDIAPDDAAHLRELFDIPADDMTDVSGTLDGTDYSGSVSADKADDFVDAMAYWIGYARKAGKAADRRVAGGPTSPRIEIGTDYCATPHGVAQTSKLGLEYKALRQAIRTWGAEHGWPIGTRGQPSADLREAYALFSHHRPWEHLKPEVDEVEEAALMPAPKRTQKGKKQ